MLISILKTAKNLLRQILPRAKLMPRGGRIEKDAPARQIPGSNSG